MEIKEQILAVLATIIHPETASNIVSMGMIDSLECNNDGVKFTLKLNKVRDPFAISIKKIAIQKIEYSFPQYKDKVTIVIKEPSAKPHTAKESKINIKDVSNIKYTIAVSSGKGGVGKSTVTANIAYTLSQMGYKVGIMDADIYGPSMPKMFGVEDYKPIAEIVDGKELLVPANRDGIKIMSIGFFINKEDALIWRGPMATNALKQLLHQTSWGELDFLLIDLPPGTGDIHLTLIGELKLSGAIVVSTPQKVALIDAIRGISMFKAKDINVPILGLVENMAWFTPEELPENKYYIFGKHGCVELAKQQDVPLLGQIPIVESICQSSDEGVSAQLNNAIVKDSFVQLTNNMIKSLTSL